jgi:hypothetical protein
MKRTTLSLLVTMMTLAAFVGNARTAAADTNDYADGMKDFAPVIERWAYETLSTTAAAQAKPELACSADMAELAIRGFSIAADLDGMTVDAPKMLVPTHRTVVQDVRLMATAAEIACGDASGAADVAAQAHSDFAGPMKRLRNYAQRAAQKGWGR